MFVSSRGAGTGGATGANAPFAFLLRVQGVQFFSKIGKMIFLEPR